jgi:hypothetical protein
MSDVDDIIDREASPGHAARVAAVIASDSLFAVFGTAVFVPEAAAARPEARGRSADEPAPHGEHLNVKPELLREFCGHLIAPGDETVVLYADGKPVEIPV